METTTKKPSEILKEGDIVYVTYIGDSINGFELTGDLEQEIKKKAQPYIQLNLFQKPIVQAASITLDPNTGEVYSMVGGNRYFSSYFNRAVQSKRQPDQP